MNEAYDIPIGKTSILKHLAQLNERETILPDSIVRHRDGVYDCVESSLQSHQKNNQGVKVMKKNITKNVMLLAIGIGIGIIAGAVASSVEGGQAPQRRHINLPGKNTELPFSDAVLVGDTLYLAGKLGIDPQTNKVPDKIEKEIQLMLDGFKKTLAEAGMTMDNLVTVTIYCPDLTLYEKFNSVYRTYFGKNFPARAFIGSGPLLRGAHFEMQAIAAR